MDPQVISIIAVIVAVLFGPVAAVQVEKFISRIRERKNRRVNLFKTLMTTRGDTTSVEHVQALNQIDLEFGNKKFKKVVDAWQIYFNHLSDNIIGLTNEQMVNWDNRRQDYLIDLLFEMGKSLGYDYSKAVIKRNSYVPRLFSNLEAENSAIRRLLLELLNGERSIPVTFIQELDEEEIQKQKELRQAMLDYYEGQRPNIL